MASLVAWPRAGVASFSSLVRCHRPGRPSTRRTRPCWATRLLRAASTRQPRTSSCCSRSNSSRRSARCPVRTGRVARSRRLTTGPRSNIPHAMSASPATTAATSRSTWPGRRPTRSASRNTSTLAATAAATPARRASPLPGIGSCTTRAPWAAATAAVPSVEALSTTTTSSTSRASSAAYTTAPTVADSFQAGITATVCPMRSSTLGGMVTRHLVVVGPMAVGKTTVGEALAGWSGRPLRDSDVDLEAARGITGRELAESEGIDALHLWEADHLRLSLADPTPSVIAAAASVVDVAAGRAGLAEPFVIALTAPPEVRAARAEHEDDHHRILSHPPDRDAAYRAVADVVIDTSGGDPAASAAAAREAIPADVVPPGR